MELTAEKIKLIKKNDRRVIGELYTDSFNILMSSAVRYHKNKEDQMNIVNNTFIKIITNIDQFKVGTSYYAWIKKIVSNEIIDNFRRNKHYKDLFNQDIDTTNYSQTTGPEADTFINEEYYQKLLDKLPPATKLVFNLHEIDGVPYDEICTQLNISYETAKWHVKEAKKRLRTLLQLEYNLQK